VESTGIRYPFSAAESGCGSKLASPCAVMSPWRHPLSGRRPPQNSYRRFTFPGDSLRIEAQRGRGSVHERARAAMRLTVASAGRSENSTVGHGGDQLWRPKRARSCSTQATCMATRYDRTAPRPCRSRVHDSAQLPARIGSGPITSAGWPGPLAGTADRRTRDESRLLA